MIGKPPPVSVNMCCYNSERYLARAVQSVLDQTFKEFELIIVNDGSSDRTEEIVRTFEDPRIRYEYQENRGLAATRKRALELSRGKYIAFLDHDDLWVRDKLALQIPLMEARDDVAVVYGNAATIDGDGNVISENWAGFRARDGNVFADLLLDGNFVNWQTVVIRRSLLERVGGFRPYKIAEDYDLLLRCAVDHMFVGIDCVLAQFRRHTSNYSYSRIGDPFHSRRRLGEQWVELLEIKEYWLANLPPQHTQLIPALQRDIAKLHYWLGRHFCLAGDIQGGRAHLQQAASNSAYVWCASTVSALAELLGSRFYPGFERLVGNRAFRYLMKRFARQKGA